MYIRYKGIYYFITFLIVIIGVYCNKHILLCLPILFLYYLYRFNFEVALSIFVVTACLYFISKPQFLEETNQIQAVVEEVNQFNIIVKSNKHKIKLSTDTSDFQIGDIIIFDYTASDFKTPRNIGEFNQRNYYYGKRIYQQGVITNYQIVHHKTTFSSLVKEYINNSNNDIVKSYTNLIVFGIKEEDMQNLYSQLISLSIVHLIAISGMHFTLFSQFLETILGKFFVEKTRNIMIIIILSIYMLILKDNISAFRAFSIYILNKINKDYFNPFDLFSFVGILMLMINPYYIYHLSFIYSFSLYFFLLLLKKNKNSNFYIYLVSIPILCMFNYEINLSSLLFCYVMQPMIELLYVGLLFNAMFLFLCNPLLVVVIHMFQQLVSFFEAISMILIVGKPNSIFICSYYFFVVFHLFLIESKKKSIYIIGCFGLVGFLYVKPYINPVGEITMIDVGQGDCFLIRLPYNQGNYLVDTGGLINYDTATAYIIPYLKSQGVKALDILFLSHDDFDHIGAKESLLANFIVKTVVSDHDFYLHNQYLEITSLNNNQYDNENDNSLVLYFDFSDFSCLFTGDIGANVEEAIIQTYPNLQADIVKIAHHGSASSSSASFIQQLNVKIALISVGEHNLYHHPNQKVLDILNAYGIKIYRSDQDGMTTIFFQSGKFSIRKILN